jgi:hypothetical protein
VLKEVVKVAVPNAPAPVTVLKFTGTTVAVHGGVPQVENVTVPVGPTPLLLIAEPLTTLVPVTVATSVTDCPVVTVAVAVPFAVTTVPVEPGVIVIALGATWVLALKLLSPA